MIVKAERYESDRKLADSGTVKVLHLINGEHFSGAERVQDLLASALPAFGFSAEFVALKKGRFGECRRSSSPLNVIPMRSRFDTSVATRIGHLVKKNNYQIVHAHTPRSLMIGGRVAKKSGIPLVYHVHSPVGRDCGVWWKNSLNTWMEKRWLRRCDHMICVSASLRDYMLKLGHHDDRITVIRNGVPKVDSALATPSSSGWTLGTVALFRPRKGLEILIEALSLLKNHSSAIRLLAVGSFETPEYELAIRKLAESKGVTEMIEWTGFERDVNARIRQMQVMILPSLYGEGLPMVILEAMACGVPVVASNVEGIPEAVRDGTDGRIFKAGNPRDLADRIVDVTSDRQRWMQMGANAQQHQRERLSDTAMARAVAALYGILLAKQPTAAC